MFNLFMSMTLVKSANIVTVLKHQCETKHNQVKLRCLIYSHERISKR